MTRSFGPIMQTGFVVRDIRAAMQHWTTALGVGPFWLTERVAFTEIAYRGSPTNLKMTVAVAFSGRLQIELIQASGDAPSVYRDHLACHGEGLQHVGVLVEDYDGVVSRAGADGIAELQVGRVTSGLRFAYLDTAGPLPGTMVELIESTAGMRKFLARLEQTAASWDGRDPVRTL